ncbi:MAG TPA: SRPBCC domain-containing protein [Chitinophagaceae bacterium]|nr:SRPBCC domain-containing protein [Chitinophagaceae bacterium]
MKFENKGIILKYLKERILSYSHLSSVSRLPDNIENYTVIEFVLTPLNKQTTLTINITNFPAEAIQKHLAFYWRGTIYNIKQYIENHTD